MLAQKAPASRNGYLTLSSLASRPDQPPLGSAEKVGSWRPALGAGLMDSQNVKAVEEPACMRGYDAHAHGQPRIRRPLPPNDLAGCQKRKFHVDLNIFTAHTVKVVGGLLSILSLLALLSACGSAGGQPGSGATGQPGQPGQQSTSTGLNIRLIADKFAFTSAGQFCQALFTAEVVVGSHGAARWNTPDGTLPAGITTPEAVFGYNLRIYTPVTFSSLVPLLDHRHVATKEFLTVGGQVGNDRYRIIGEPDLAGIGGHFLVVLAPSTPQIGGNTEETLVVGWAYPVDAHGVVTLQQAGNPNEPGPGQLQPAITIPLASLKQQLASCK